MVDSTPEDAHRPPDAALVATGSVQQAQPAVRRAPVLRRFGGGRVPMVASTVTAVFVLLAMVGVLDWSLPLAGSRADPGTPTAAGSKGRVFSRDGPKGPAASLVDRDAVAALATELAASGWPSLALTADSSGVTISGAVANERERDEVLAIAERSLLDVPVEDRLMISAGEPAHVRIEVSQRRLRLEGTVPNLALAEELMTRANAVYFDDQIDNGVTVDPGAGTPLAMTASGTVSNARLIEAVVTRFSGIVGVDPILTVDLQLVPPSPTEEALNGFGDVRFATGSAVVLTESAPILDHAAVVLASNPQVAIEIGSHAVGTGTGDDEDASALTEARAEVVKAELVARGVRNELVARGFGRNRMTPGDGGLPDADPPGAGTIELRLLD